MSIWNNDEDSVVVEAEESIESVDDGVDESIAVLDAVDDGIEFPGVEALTFGASNKNVEFIQKTLIAKGYDIVSGVSGKYDMPTVVAVQDFCSKEMNAKTPGKSINFRIWNKIVG